VSQKTPGIKGGERGNLDPSKKNATGKIRLKSLLPGGDEKSPTKTDAPLYAALMLVPQQGRSEKGMDFSTNLGGCPSAGGRCLR